MHISIHTAYVTSFTLKIYLSHISSFDAVISRTNIYSKFLDRQLKRCCGYFILRSSTTYFFFFFVKK